MMQEDTMYFENAVDFMEVECLKTGYFDYPVIPMCLRKTGKHIC